MLLQFFCKDSGHKRGCHMAKKTKTISKKAGAGSEQFQLRLPDGMRDALTESAARNGRSMNAEVVTALAMYFANEDTAPKQSQLSGIETAIKDLSEQQQQTIETLELVKKIILSPIAPKK
jgi:plasmid stability protein